MLQFHHDLGSSWPALGPLIAYPKMRIRSSKPEKSFRIEIAHDVQDTEVWHHSIAQRLSETLRLIRMGCIHEYESRYIGREAMCEDRAKGDSRSRCL